MTTSRWKHRAFPSTECLLGDVTKEEAVEDMLHYFSTLEKIYVPSCNNASEDEGASP